MQYMFIKLVSEILVKNQKKHSDNLYKMIMQNPVEVRKFI